MVALLCLASGSAPAGPRSSNPAFLGIEMRNPGGPDPCIVRAAIPDSPAEQAGLRPGDVVLAFDGVAIASCTMLLDQITSHPPGAVVPIRIHRAGGALTVTVQLTTRDALLGRRLGKPVDSTHLVAVDDGTVYDLSALGGVTIVGLYNPACVECAGLFARFQAWARSKARQGGPVPLVLAVSVTERDDLQVMQRGLDVPLVTGELGPLFTRDIIISDPERLGVLVIDGRGTIQYLGPVAPSSDDVDAVLDDLFAVADQAARWSK